MNCRQAERWIEDYIDGELQPERVSELKAHLESCTACSRRIESLRNEDRLYEAYGQSLAGSQEIAPSMWDGIRRELEKGTHAGDSMSKKITNNSSNIFAKIFSHPIPGRRLAFASCLVLVSVCGTLLVVHQYQRVVPTSEKGIFRQAPGSQPRDLESALLSIKKAEQEYEKAIKTLSTIADEKKYSLDPALAAELENNLKAIDEAIASSRKAYHAHPVDPDLARYMLKAYQKKVELLQELALSTT